TSHLSFITLLPPPRSTLFPYTTLFRSALQRTDPMTSALIRLLRPHQWIKNGFLFMGVVFGHGWNDAGLVAEALVLFAAFCLVSRSEEHTSELQSRGHLVCRLLLEKNNT